MRYGLFAAVLVAYVGLDAIVMAEGPVNIEQHRVRLTAIEGTCGQIISPGPYHLDVIGPHRLMLGDLRMDSVRPWKADGGMYLFMSEDGFSDVFIQSFDGKSVSGFIDIQIPWRAPDGPHTCYIESSIVEDDVKIP